jgi:hypothetical protein
VVRRRGHRQLRRHRRQVDAEAAAPPLFAVHLDGSSALLDDAQHRRQAQAGALPHFLGPRRLALASSRRCRRAGPSTAWSLGMTAAIGRPRSARRVDAITRPPSSARSARTISGSAPRAVSSAWTRSWSPRRSRCSSVPRSRLACPKRSSRSEASRARSACPQSAQ